MVEQEKDKDTAGTKLTKYPHLPTAYVPVTTELCFNPPAL